MTKNNNGGLQLELVSSRQAFAAARGEWDALVDVATGGTFFLHWSWLDAWLEVYAYRVEKLLILMLRNVDGTLVAGLPLYLSKSAYGGELFFVGAGEAEDEEVMSEYPDVLVRQGYQSSAIELLADWLASKAVAFHRWRIPHLLEDALLTRDLLSALARRGLPVLREPQGYRYRIDLPSDWQQYLQQIKPSVRRRIGNRRRRAARLGRVRYRTVKQAAQLRIALESLRILHTRRWHVKGQPGVFANKRYRLFFNLAFERIFKEGRLCLRSLEIDGVVIGVMLLVSHKNSWYYYQSGFDLENHADLAPGVLLISDTLQQGIAAGVEFVDLMKDGKDSYKNDYTQRPSPMFNAQVFPAGPTGWLAYCETLLKHKLRRQLALLSMQ